MKHIILAVNDAAEVRTLITQINDAINTELARGGTPSFAGRDLAKRLGAVHEASEQCVYVCTFRDDDEEWWDPEIGGSFAAAVRAMAERVNTQRVERGRPPVEVSLDPDVHWMFDVDQWTSEGWMFDDPDDPHALGNEQMIVTRHTLAQPD